MYKQRQLLVRRPKFPSQRRKLISHPLTTQCTRTSSRVVNDKEDPIGDLMIVSPSLWPEKNASAAGVRTTSLLNHFTSKTSRHICNKVHYGCGIQSQKNQNSNEQHGIPNDVTVHYLPPNRSDEILSVLTSNVLNDTLQTVIFDRFFAEEVYSFHFYNNKPNVLRILDMQDMHSLRKHRELIVQMDTQERRINVNGDTIYEDENDASLFQLSNSLMRKVMNSHPMITSQNNKNINISSQKDPNSTLLRELASIHRSDLTLVCSPYELDLLQNEYGIPKHKLSLASFFIDTHDINDKYFTSFKSETDDISATYSFESRKDFVVLGGFKHPPNLDQVKVLKYDIWPKIRNYLPQACVHVYGAYTPQSILKLHDAKSGFLIKGYASNLSDVLSKSRVMLAPLRFGAGIKGKIIDSWKYGCPVVTTPIGSEGMTIDIDTQEGGEKWGGIIASNSDDIVQGSVDLYTNKSQWIQCQSQGRILLHDLFQSERNLTKLNHDIQVALTKRQSNRKSDYFSACLWSQQSRSTEYFSRWIEQKELKKNKD